MADRNFRRKSHTLPGWAQTCTAMHFTTAFPVDLKSKVRFLEARFLDSFHIYEVQPLPAIPLLKYYVQKKCFPSRSDHLRSTASSLEDHNLRGDIE